MSYHLGETAEEATTLARIADSQAELLREFRAAEKQRKYAVMIGVASAVFAAFRLGILALPTLRDWRAKRTVT